MRTDEGLPDEPNGAFGDENEAQDLKILRNLKRIKTIILVPIDQSYWNYSTRYS